MSFLRFSDTAHLALDDRLEQFAAKPSRAVALQIVEDHVGKLVRPGWKEWWANMVAQRGTGHLTTAWFHHDEGRLDRELLAAFEAMARYALDAKTTALERQQRAELTQALAIYLTSRGHNDPMETPAASADGKVRTGAPKVTVRRNSKDRNNYIYFAMVDGKHLKEIKNRVNEKQDWERLDNLESVSAAAKRFAKKHNLQWPIQRS